MFDLPDEIIGLFPSNSGFIFISTYYLGNFFSLVMFVDRQWIGRVLLPLQVDYATFAPAEYCVYRFAGYGVW